jgi:tripartite-type tricarboxylate transporter receptor subunit TctC
MRRKPKLHLVGQDPANIFEDLDQLRADLTTPTQQRKRTTETFARIPHAADPVIKARLAGLGVDPMSKTPAEFGKFIADETEKWGKVIRTAGIHVE